MESLDDINNIMNCEPSTSKEDPSMDKSFVTCQLCEDVYVDPCRTKCCGKLYCRLCLISKLIAQPTCPSCPTPCPATNLTRMFSPDAEIHHFVLNSLPLESAVAYNNKIKYCNNLRLNGKLRNIDMELAARSMVKWADHVMLAADENMIDLRIRIDAKILKADQGHDESFYVEDRAMVLRVVYNMTASLLRGFIKDQVASDKEVIITIYTKEGLLIEDSTLMHQILLDSGRAEDGRVWIFCDFNWEPLSELIEDMPVLEKECYETEAPTLKSMLEEPVIERHEGSPDIMKLQAEQFKPLQLPDGRNLMPEQFKRNSFGNPLPRPEDFQPLLSAVEPPTLSQVTSILQTPPKHNGVTVANHPVLAAQLQQPMFSLSPQGKKRPAQSQLNGGKPPKIMNSMASSSNPTIKSALEAPAMSTTTQNIQIKSEPGKPVTPASASNGFGMVVSQARAMAPGMTVSQAMAMSKTMANNKGNGIKSGHNPFLLGALKTSPSSSTTMKTSPVNPLTTSLASLSPVNNMGNMINMSNAMPILSLPSQTFHSTSSTPIPTLSSSVPRKPVATSPNSVASQNANMAFFQQMLSQQMPNFAAFNPMMLSQLQLSQLYPQNFQTFMQTAQQFSGSIFPPQFPKPKKSATVQPIVRTEAAATMDNDKLWQMYGATDECKKAINQPNVAVSINQPGSL